MNRTKPIIVLTLLLAAQTAAGADSRIAKHARHPDPPPDRSPGHAKWGGASFRLGEGI